MRRRKSSEVKTLLYAAAAWWHRTPVMVGAVCILNQSKEGCGIMGTVFQHHQTHSKANYAVLGAGKDVEKMQRGAKIG